MANRVMRKGFRRERETGFEGGIVSKGTKLRCLGITQFDHRTANTSSNTSL